MVFNDKVESIKIGNAFTGVEARELYRADNFPNHIVFIDQNGDAPIARALGETPYVFAAMDLRESSEQIYKKLERESFPASQQLE